MAVVLGVVDGGTGTIHSLLGGSVDADTFAALTANQVVLEQQVLLLRLFFGIRLGREGFECCLTMFWGVETGSLL